jgi:hypothetical protein
MQITWCETVIRIKFSVLDVDAVSVVPLLLFMVLPFALKIDIRLNMSFQTNLNSRGMTRTLMFTLADSTNKLNCNETVPLVLPF